MIDGTALPDPLFLRKVVVMLPCVPCGVALVVPYGPGSTFVLIRSWGIWCVVSLRVRGR